MSDAAVLTRTEPPTWRLTAEDRELLRRTMLSDANQDEADTFIRTCERTGLDPFARQIYATFRFNRQANRKTMAILVSIDGFRLIAERTGDYEGQLGPWWCGPDEVWKEVWLNDKQPPAAARVGVWRRGFREPLFVVAHWRSYAQKTSNGSYSGLWGQMPELMLAKVAEALALRRAFPQDLSGLYTPEEMAQAWTGDTPERTEVREAAPASAPQPAPQPAPQAAAPAPEAPPAELQPTPPGRTPQGERTNQMRRLHAILRRLNVDTEDRDLVHRTCEAAYHGSTGQAIDIVSLEQADVRLLQTCADWLDRHGLPRIQQPQRKSIWTATPGESSVPESSGDRAAAQQSAPGAAPKFRPPAGSAPSTPPVNSTPPSNGNSQQADAKGCAGEGCTSPVTAGQRVVSLKQFGRPLCPACQKLARNG